MKRILLFTCLVIGASQMRAQDTVRYFYAILNVDRVHEYANVEYSNGFQEDLWKKLHLTLKNTRHEVLFRCFEYLNESSYDYTGGELATGIMVPSDTNEYIFKRRKK